MLMNFDNWKIVCCMQTPDEMCVKVILLDWAAIPVEKTFSANFTGSCLEAQGKEMIAN